MSNLFLFGAGASSFCGKCHPNSPPLGKDLFQKLEEHSETARSLSEPIKKIFNQDFERGMAALEEEIKKGNFWKIHYFLKEMGQYFLQFSIPISHGNNLYVKLINLLLNNKGRFIFSTLNYEMLLEEAAFSCGISEITYDEKKQWKKRETLPLIKPHGSCNFIPDLKNNVIKSNKISMGFNAQLTETGVHVLTRLEALKKIETSQSNIDAPVMAIYAPGKPIISCRYFVKNQQTLFEKAVLQAKRIIIIGVRVYEDDKHIWQPLAKTKASIGYVSPSSEDFISWAKKNKLKKSTIISDTFKNCISVLPQFLSDG